MFNQFLALAGAPLADPEPVAPVADQLSGLRDFAGMALTAVVVLIVISGAISVVLFIIGKVSALTNAQTKSMMWAGRIFLGAAIVGSVGGLVFYGSGLGKFDLMPAGAQQPTIDVTKNPAKSTCSNTVDKSDPTGVNTLSEEEIERYARALLSDEDANKVTASKTAFGGTTVRKIKWTPAGPDCTSNNLTADSCKDVFIYFLGGDDNRGTAYKPRTASECSN
jgi:hypothetical protein